MRLQDVPLIANFVLKFAVFLVFDRWFVLTETFISSVLCLNEATMSTILLDSVITGSKITARYCDSLQVGDDAWVAGPGYCIVTHVLKVYFMQRFRVKDLPCFLSHPYNLLIPPITSTSTNQVVLLSKWGWLFQRTEEKLLPSCSSSHTLYDPSCVNCLFIFIMFE